MEIIDSIFNKNRNRRKNKKISLFSFLDKNTDIDNDIAITRFCKIRNSSIGSYSYIGMNSSINNCEIGRFCSIGPSVKIGLGRHPINFISTSPVFYNPENILNIKIVNKHKYKEYERVIIKNDVWLGANSIIMDGVTVGNGAIVGAGAIVTKDVPDYAIVGGIPANIIKYRFDKKTINDLLESSWWENNIEVLSNFTSFSENPNLFIEKYSNEVTNFE